jgi:nucleoid DNA-binding protein
MNIVEEVIVEYLRSNRRLVIPNFGAFMAKESGERIFSGLLRTDDGVLSSLLKARGLNEMEAAITIDRFIFEVRHELEQYGYCRLGEVGTLRIEPETKALRLYPPVHGELPKQTPYVPKIDERRTDAAEREQRVLAHFAEPQGGKACEAGLKTKDESKSKVT